MSHQSADPQARAKQRPRLPPLTVQLRAPSHRSGRDHDPVLAISGFTDEADYYQRGKLDFFQLADTQRGEVIRIVNLEASNLGIRFQLFGCDEGPGKISFSSSMSIDALSRAVARALGVELSL